MRGVPACLPECDRTGRAIFSGGCVGCSPTHDDMAMSPGREGESKEKATLHEPVRQANVKNVNASRPLAARLLRLQDDWYDYRPTILGVVALLVREANSVYGNGPEDGPLRVNEGTDGHWLVWSQSGARGQSASERQVLFLRPGAASNKPGQPRLPDMMLVLVFAQAVAGRLCQVVGDWAMNRSITHRPDYGHVERTPADDFELSILALSHYAVNRVHLGPYEANGKSWWDQGFQAEWTSELNMPKLTNFPEPDEQSVQMLALLQTRLDALLRQVGCSVALRGKYTLVLSGVGAGEAREQAMHFANVPTTCWPAMLMAVAYWLFGLAAQGAGARKELLDKVVHDMRGVDLLWASAPLVTPLPNHGNTCFFNAVVQLLRALPAARQTSFHAIMPEDAKIRAAEIMEGLVCGTCPTYEREDVTRIAAALGQGRYQPGQQEDASEWLAPLLEAPALKRDVAVKLEHRTQQQQSGDGKCTDIGAAQAPEGTPIWLLAAPNAQTTTLQALVDMQVRAQRGQGDVCHQTIVHAPAPPYLVLVCGVFVVDRTTMHVTTHKNDIKIQLSDGRIRVPVHDPSVNGAPGSASSVEYQVTSAILHKGTLNSGHYTACSMDMTRGLYNRKTFYMFDDDKKPVERNVRILDEVCEGATPYVVLLKQVTAGDFLGHPGRTRVPAPAPGPDKATGANSDPLGLEAPGAQDAQATVQQADNAAVAAEIAQAREDVAAALADVQQADVQQAEQLLQDRADSASAPETIRKAQQVLAKTQEAVTRAKGRFLTDYPPGRTLPGPATGTPDTQRVANAENARAAAAAASNAKKAQIDLQRAQATKAEQERRQAAIAAAQALRNEQGARDNASRQHYASQRKNAKTSINANKAQIASRREQRVKAEQDAEQARRALAALREKRKGAVDAARRKGASADTKALDDQIAAAEAALAAAEQRVREFTAPA